MNKNNSKLLVSLCNVLPRGLGLGVFDFEEDSFEWVDLREISQDILGVDGLSYDNSKYSILTQVADNGVSAITELDEKLKITKNFILNHTKDAHSLIPFNGGFLVTDTGRDRVNKITFSKDKKSIEESEYWANDKTGSDANHLNSIIKFNDDIYVSLLGPKPESGWKDAKNGQIINITSGEIIVDELKHPHSLHVDDGNLYWLESLTGLVHRFSKNNGHDIIQQLDGYVRGFTHDENYFYVGASSYRKRSRNTGVEYEPLSQKESNLHSWIYKINKKSFEIEKRSMSEYGSEIFDLLILKHEFEFTDQKNSILKRLFKYESDYYKNREKSFCERCGNEVYQTGFISFDKFRKSVREFVNKKEWEKAKFFLESILSKEIDAEFEYLMGFTLDYGFKDFKNGISYYEKALKHGFDEFWVKFRRGEAYLKIKDYARAKEDLESAYSLNPKNSDVKKLLEQARNSI